MLTTTEDVQKWASYNGHDGSRMWPVTREEVRAWAKDFHAQLVDPNAGSLCDRFERTVSPQQNEYFQHMLRGVLSVMTVGYPLSKAMSMHPDAFSEGFITIIRYGEMYGEVDLTVQRFLEKPEEMEPRCAVRRETSPHAGQGAR